MVLIRPLVAAVLLAGVAAQARAEDCRQYPPGPARAACASRTHPGFAAKQQHCQEEGRAIGLQRAPGAAGSGLKGYVQACMQRH
jgi:hypothetical protein